VVAGFAAGAVDAAGVGGEAGAIVGLGEGVVAGSAAGVGFATGATSAGGAEVAGAEASVAAAVFDLEDFLAAVEAVALVSLFTGAATPVSAVSDFLLFLDVAVVELPLAAVVVSPDAWVFSDLEDFFAVDVSVAVELSAASSVADFLVFLDFEVVELVLAAAVASGDTSAFFELVDFFAVDVSADVELSAASVFFDLVDFFAVEMSGVALESAASDCLLLVDFLALEESAAAVPSGVVVFFFFFAFAALVSLWSVVAGVCAAWAADAGRRQRFASTSRRATSRATWNRLRVRFILSEFLSPAADQALCLARG
jgi:hypothetical protein